MLMTQLTWAERDLHRCTKPRHKPYPDGLRLAWFEDRRRWKGCKAANTHIHIQGPSTTSPRTRFKNAKYLEPMRGSPALKLEPRQKVAKKIACNWQLCNLGRKRKDSQTSKVRLVLIHTTQNERETSSNSKSSGSGCKPHMASCTILFKFLLRHSHYW